MKLFILMALLFVFGSQFAHAAGSGGSSFQFSFGSTSTGQDDLNSYADSLNTAGTKNLSGGLEYIVDYQYRYSGMFALVIRPTIYSNSASGGGLDMKLTGYTFFPMLRLYPLENGFIKFFMQTGLGFASLSGTVSAGGASVDFKGSGFGAQAGLGAEFCFSGNHCMVLEGNYRYMPIERNIVSSSSGGGLGLASAGNELEFQNKDVSTSLSGLQAVIGYHMYF